MSGQDNTSGSGSGSSITDGLATFGKIQSTMGLIVGICIGCILMVIGFELYEHPQKETKKVTAAAISSICQMVNEGGRHSRMRKECTTRVKYSVAGKNYSSIVKTKTQYSKGDPVALLYNPKNPADAIASSEKRPPMLGTGLAACGIFIIVAAGANAYFARKSKTYAAVSGAEGILGAL
jgi:hypothetical protein